MNASLHVLLQEEERKQREQAKETARAAEKAENDLLEQVKEQEQLEANQLLELALTDSVSKCTANDRSN